MCPSEKECVGEKSRVSLIVGGYNKDRPPEDDCCPICFDDFHFPCRTSCGHWFCSSCILAHWSYATNFNPSKCPMCACLITKLHPEPSLLKQQKGNAVKILEDIEQYNRVTVGGWHALFLKAQSLPALIRRRFRQNPSAMMMRSVFNVSRLIGLLLSILYEICDFNFFPNASRGIEVLFEICGFSLVAFLVLDATWYTLMLRRRAGRLVQHAN